MGEERYTVVVIPDTQVMVAKHTELLDAMSDWIVAQAEELRIKCVLHIGDVVHNGAQDERQFRASDLALKRIEDAGIPLLISIGNHDYDNMAEIDRSASMFNRYFGLSRFQYRPWFGGAFEHSKSENCYFLLHIGGIPHLLLALEFAPREEVVQWANEVLAAHADRRAIVITHCYMYMFGQRTKPGDLHHPEKFAGVKDGNDGEQLWQKCFRHHANIAAVFSGHHGKENVSYRTDAGEQGNIVLQSFQNWQSTPFGGEGRIRIVTFAADGTEVNMSAFNPRTGQYEAGAGYEVSVSLQSGSRCVQFPLSPEQQVSQ